MKNESWLGGGKYSENLLNENGTSDWTSATTEQKKLLKLFAIVCGSDSFPGIFHVVDVIFKILVAVIFLLALGELRSYFYNFCNHYVASP